MCGCLLFRHVFQKGGVVRFLVYPGTKPCGVFFTNSGYMLLYAIGIHKLFTMWSLLRRDAVRCGFAEPHRTAVRFSLEKHCTKIRTVGFSTKQSAPHRTHTHRTALIRAALNRTAPHSPHRTVNKKAARYRTVGFCFLTAPHRTYYTHILRKKFQYRTAP